MAGLLGGYSYDPLQLDPNLIAIQQASASNAQNFQNNLPGYQNMLYNQAQNKTMTNQASQTQGARYNANAKGLLYSGLRQGAEAGIQGSNATDLAGTRANINYGTQNTANQMTQQATGLGLGVQEAQTQMNKQNYLNAMDNYKQQMGALEGFGQGVGSLAGKAIGAGLL